MLVPAKTRRWPWRLSAAGLILLAAGLHLTYLAFDCPLDLAPDEAHYWDWSRYLDWSYYSKGPLVAYLIRASCAVAGPISEQLTGSEMLAVRLPAILCGSLLLASLYVLTIQVYGKESLALGLVACALTLPIVAAGSSLMTIDAPYACCWGWALVLGHHAVFRRASWAWPVTGVVIGLGILAKYTMVLWLPSLGLFLLLTPGYRRLLAQPGVWIMMAIAGVCCSPILLWNLQHDWVTFRHVGGQAGVHTASVRWLGPLVYLGTQAALYLGFWFVAWLAAMIVYRPWGQTEAGVRYLWWMSAPMFGVFLLFSLKTPEEPNWPVTAYVSGMVLAAAWLVEQLRSPEPWQRRLTIAGFITASLLAIAGTLLVHYTHWVQPLLVQLSGPATTERPMPLRRFDPTCRLRGWHFLAEAVDRVRTELRAEGIEPVLAGSSWTLPGEIGFYCQGHPRVYSFGLLQGDRHSQYDLWHPNPISDSAAFLGQTFILIGDLGPTLRESFEHVEATRTMTYQEKGQSVASWPITVCRRYRGLSSVPETSQRAF